MTDIPFITYMRIYIEVESLYHHVKGRRRGNADKEISESNRRTTRIWVEPLSEELSSKSIPVDPKIYHLSH